MSRNRKSLAERAKEHVGLMGIPAEARASAKAVKLNDRQALVFYRADRRYTAVVLYEESPTASPRVSKPLRLTSSKLEDLAYVTRRLAALAYQH